MSLLNQQFQADISPITPLATDRVDDTSVVNTASAEAVVWYYSNSGVWDAASGQAAGTMCYAKLTYSGVLNGMGSAIGNYYDTSLSFAAATRASTLVNVPEEAFSKMESMSVANKMVYIATWLDTNGDYAIDHRRGAVWLKTKADPTNDAATYKYATTLTGGGTGDKVDLVKIGGVATLVDDAAFGIATSPVIPGGFLVDETGTDSVDEGDVGAARMTADRVLLTKVSDGTNEAAILARTTGTESPAVTDDALVVYDVGSSGGGVSGGGLGDYVFDSLNTKGQGIAAYASGTTLTVSGHNFTPNARELQKIERYNSSSVIQATYTPQKNTITVSTTSGVSTYTIAGESFAASDLFVVYQQGPERTVTNATNSQRQEEISPLSQQVVEESLVDTTNVAAAATYYPSSLGMAMLGYKNFSITGKYIDGDATTTTLIVQGTEDSDSTNADWVAIQGQIQGITGTVTGTVSGVAGTAIVPGSVCTGLSTALAQTMTFAWDFDNCNMRYIRVILTPGDATNTAIIYARRTY